MSGLFYFTFTLLVARFTDDRLRPLFNYVITTVGWLEFYFSAQIWLYQRDVITTCLSDATWTKSASIVRVYMRINNDVEG